MSSSRSKVAALSIMATLVAGVQPAYADAVVTLCNSDNEVGVAPRGEPLNLQSALRRGGLITFDCGEKTIQMTHERGITLASSVTIDGGNSVTLDGENKNGVFHIRPGITLTLVNLNIKAANASLSDFLHGVSPRPLDGSVVHGDGAVELEGVTITDSRTPFDVQSLKASNSHFANNRGDWVIKAQTVDLFDITLSNNAGSPLTNTTEPGFAKLEKVHSRENKAPIKWSGEINVRNSAFSRNSGIDGGALALEGVATIEKSDFFDNKAVSGGAISFKSGELKLRRNTFTTNHAFRDGGAILASGSTPAKIISQYDKYRGNLSSTRSGGAIYIFSPETSLVAGPVLFAENSSAQSGGAIYARGGNVLVSRGTFVGNKSSTGGALATGPGAALVRLGNTLVVRNSAANGGGISATALELRNVTVAENEGGGLTVFEGPNRGANLANSIVAMNVGGNCTAPPDGTSAYTNMGNNVQFPGFECGSAIPSTNPNLDDMFVPTPGSPVRSAGNDQICSNYDLVGGRDVYGAVRPEALHCAIGAVESDLEKQAISIFQRLDQPSVSVTQFLKSIGVIGIGP